MFSKKIISLFLSLLLIAAAIPAALAEGTSAELNNSTTLEASQTPVILLKYAYTSSVKASLSFNGNTAYCKGSVTPSGSYSASLTVTLYKKSGSSWNYIASWSGSSTGGSQATASGSASVTSGTYKVVTRGNIGSGLENPSVSITKTK